MMLGRLFNPKDKGLLLTIVHDPTASRSPFVSLCRRPRSTATRSISCVEIPVNTERIDRLRVVLNDRAPARHWGARAQLNFAAFRSVLDGERGEGTFTRVERWPSNGCRNIPD